MVATAGVSSNNEPQRVKQMQGNIVLNDDIIEFENVPLRTPNNDTLVESLNFRVRRLLLTGTRFKLTPTRALCTRPSSPFAHVHTRN